MTVAERTRTAREVLVEWLEKNRGASKSQAAHWINNQRVGGERLTLPYSEINRIFLEVRLNQKTTAFNPPRLIVTPAPPEPPKPVPMEVQVPGTLGTETKFFTPGRPERQKYAEDLALENPTRGANWIREQVVKKFGIGLDVKLILSALETARTLAGLKSRLRQKSPPPASPQEPAMPLPEPPPPPLKPDAILREAAGVLKLLVDKMGWKSVTLRVDHEGGIEYDASPLPVLPQKGAFRL